MLKWANRFVVNETERDFFSPDRRVKCTFILSRGRVFYSVFCDEKPIVRKSRLGFLLKDEQELGLNLVLVKEHSDKVDEVIEMPWGEDHFIRNNYNERTFYLAEVEEKRRVFVLRFRVFNDGVAFRYEIPAQLERKRSIVDDEITEFNLDLNSKVWKIPAYQPDRYEYNYECCMARDLSKPVHTPMTLKTPNGFYLSIHEAALYDYGGMTIKLNNELTALKADITPLSDGTRAHIDLPFRTPWRMVMIADSAIDLTKNRMMICLNDPPRGDFSWVKTLKFLGIWWAMYVGEWTWAPGERHGATTEHAKEYIDACVRLGISGLLIEGWNDGWEGDWLENGIKNDFLASTSDFNLKEVALYAQKNNVELVGHHETVGFIDNYEWQLESAYDYYRKNGIHYVKTGYAGKVMKINGRTEFHHSQLGVQHYQKTVEVAAKNHIMLDIHEPIKGTGIERTWPNLLSREGARGQEYEGGALLPSHACILPFTRLLAGGMDYTNGIFDLNNSTKCVMTTLARQLAYFVIMQSGMQMAADRPRFYEEVFPEVFNFIKAVPVDYEKSIPLAGEIGEYYVVARQERNGDNWYIGGVTNEYERRVRMELDFLDDGKYVAEIYRDSDDAHYLGNKLGIEIEKRAISKNDYLDLRMAAGGGFAVKITKVD